MTQKSKIWRFSGAFRIFALVLAFLYGSYGVSTCIFAFFGDTELVFYFVDINSTAPLDPWQIALGLVFMSVHIGAFIYLCLAANQFLKASKHEGFFIEEVITGCRKLGYGLMLYWLGLILIENFMPGILTYNFPLGEQIEIFWWDFVDHYVLLIVGVILLLMAQAMQEARDIDSDNKQFI